MSRESHFKTAEFACKCGCGYCAVSPRLIELLERLRALLGGHPVIITSGCRCPAHNTRVKGAANSQHLYGNAADIKVAGVPPDNVAQAAEQAGFNGIGRYKTFTHVDIRKAKARWKGST